MTIAGDTMLQSSTSRPGEIDPALARTWLLVSAATPEQFDTALTSATDQVIIDLEDGVAPSGKHDARQRIIEWLTKERAATVWVRINDRRSSHWADDVAALRGVSGVAGVMLAKTESDRDVTETFDRLDAELPVLALIESALGIEEAVSIARARGTFRLAFGSGDYRRDTHTGSDDLALAYPRSRLVIASRVAQLPGPVDGPAVGMSGMALQEACATAASLGLTGKLCLDTHQASSINAALSPSVDEIAWAQGFLSEFAARNRVIRDGSDLPRVGRADRIIALAHAFGLPATT